MQNICKGYSDQNSANLMSPSVVSYPSRWNSSVSHYPQSSLSNSRTLEADSPHQQYYKVKQMGHQVQEQDSSSTQSTGQSHQEVAATEGGIPNWQSGCNGTHGTRVDSEMKSVLSLGNPNYAYPAPQVDYSQSVARLPYTYPDSCFGGLMAPCGPQAVIHSPMMGIMPGRVPLPLNLAEDEPMYVNAKQYRAILRRREARARLEAQNKLVKARKPYLHESRHLHALKRVRGSGGRFVNTKQQQQQQSKPTSTTNRQNTLDFGLSQRNRNRSESEFRSETSEVGASTTSCSEVTDLSNNDYMLRQPGHMFSCYPNRYMSASRC